MVNQVVVPEDFQEEFPEGAQDDCQDNGREVVVARVDVLVDVVEPRSSPNEKSRQSFMLQRPRPKGY